MLAAVYLIFNEGYAATAGEALVRRELCAEAIRLGRLLAELMPGEPEARGLLALMLLHHARRDARVDADGRLVLLADQDRSRWHRGEIEEGARARRGARRPTATACRRGSRPSTSRRPPTGAGSRALYDAARGARPEPGDRAQPRGGGRDGRGARARARADGHDRAALDAYHLLHSARADLLRRLGRAEDARAAYERALELAGNPVEREFLERRLRDGDALKALRRRHVHAELAAERGERLHQRRRQRDPVALPLLLGACLGLARHEHLVEARRRRRSP